MVKRSNQESPHHKYDALLFTKIIMNYGTTCPPAPLQDNRTGLDQFQTVINRGLMTGHTLKEHIKTDKLLQMAVLTAQWTELSNCTESGNMWVTFPS